MRNFSRRTILVVRESVLLTRNLFINKTVALLNSLVVIKDWSVSAPYSHLAGGMKYHDQKLTVPIPGDGTTSTHNFTTKTMEEPISFRTTKSLL